MDFIVAAEPLLNTITHSCTDTARANQLCVDALERDFYAIGRELGFPYARFSIVTHDYQANSDLPHASNRQLDNILYSLNFDSFPAAWRGVYESKKYWQRDPLLRVALEKMTEGPGTFIDTWAQSGGHSEPVAEVFRLAAPHGLNSGLLIVHASGDHHCVISFASSESHAELAQRFANTALKQQALATLLLLNSAIDKLSHCRRCVMRARLAGQRDVTLTKTQKSVLLHYLNDPNATLSSIAAQQHISTETVKYHLKIVREKLNMHGASGHVLAHHIKTKNII